MDNSRALRRFQRFAHLDADLQSFLERKRPFAQPIGERFPFQVLHYQEIDTVLMADVIQGADARMIQRRNRPRFPLESLLQFGTGREMIR